MTNDYEWWESATQLWHDDCNDEVKVEEELSQMSKDSDIVQIFYSRSR